MADRLAASGPFNFLYSDGEYLFAYAHRRLQGGKPPPKPPGLHWLSHACGEGDAPVVQADGVYIRSPAPAQRVVLVASVPLTDEPWQAMEEGSLIVLRDGSVVSMSS